MTPAIEILPAPPEFFPALAELGRRIWREYYPGIISAAQVEHMILRRYDPALMAVEAREENLRYHRLLVAGVLAGFAATLPADAPGELKLRELYLAREFRGRGLGARLLAHVTETARATGWRALVLQVNRRNAPAIALYRRAGFVERAAAVFDLGGGFVMDDFIYAKSLAPAPDFPPET